MACDSGFSGRHDMRGCRRGCHDGI